MEETSSADEYLDSDPAGSADELQELISQCNSICTSLEDIQKQYTDICSMTAQIAEYERLASERIEGQFCGIVVLVAAIGILCGILLTSVVKGR